MFIQYLMGTVVAYFLGSIPFGYLIPKIVRNIDIRTVGSGNPGASNVAREIGMIYGIMVFTLDMLKGFLSVYLFDKLFPVGKHDVAVMLCGMAVICGHTFSIFLGFRGGKAAATGCGVFLWIAPLPLAISVGVWLLTVFISRYISLGSMLGSIAMVISVISLSEGPFGQDIPLTLFSIFISILLIFRHKSNIRNLIDGTEDKIRLKRG